MTATIASQHIALPLLRSMYAARPRGSSDLQTEFSESIEFALTLSGAKPSFFALAGDHGERSKGFVDIVEQLPDPPRYGVNEVRIHHLYRPYRIAGPQLLAVVNERSNPSIPIFWMTRDDELASLYEQGRSGELGDPALLGYPPCCAAWHFDVFFARDVEALVEVAAAGGYPEQSIISMFEGWSPEPSFFLPQEFGLAGVLRSNIQFPHLTHVACPDCISNADSPTAILEKQAAALAAELDPQGLEGLQGWLKERSKVVGQIVARRNTLIADRVASLELSVRAEDVYRRQARHLIKALAF